MVHMNNYPMVEENFLGQITQPRHERAGKSWIHHRCVFFWHRTLDAPLKTAIAIAHLSLIVPQIWFHPPVGHCLGYLWTEEQPRALTRSSSRPRPAKDLKNPRCKSLGRYFSHLWSYLKCKSRLWILVTRAFIWGTLSRNWWRIGDTRSLNVRQGAHFFPWFVQFPWYRDSRHTQSAIAVAP